MKVCVFGYCTDFDDKSKIGSVSAIIQIDFKTKLHENQLNTNIVQIQNEITHKSLINHKRAHLHKYRLYSLNVLWSILNH